MNRPERRKALLPEVLRLQREGLTGSEVGQRLGMPQETVARWAREAGSPFPARGFVRAADAAPRQGITPQRTDRPAAQWRPMPARTLRHARPDLAGLYAEARAAARDLDRSRLDSVVERITDAWGPDFCLGPLSE